MGSFKAINRLKACRHGAMLYNLQDTFIGRSLDLYGEWSEGEIRLFQQLLRPGMFVVEAGANIGSHTVFLAQVVGVTGRVLAFEPQRILFQTLCANLALNSITNVDCRQAAVGDSPGELRVPCLDYGKQQNFGALALGGHAEGETVAVVTVDSFGLSQCHLIKIDVEGMEKSVLDGARATIERCQPILYLENERKDRSADLIRAIDGLGYDMYWHCPPIFNQDNFSRNPVDVFPNLTSINMLCFPRKSNHRLTGFNRVEVPRT
jgi:FkbM family methyltransferase